MPFKKQSTKIFFMGLFLLIFGAALMFAVTFFRGLSSNSSLSWLDSPSLISSGSNFSEISLVIGIIVMAIGLYYKLK